MSSTMYSPSRLFPMSPDHRLTHKYCFSSNPNWMVRGKDSCVNSFHGLDKYVTRSRFLGCGAYVPTTRQPTTRQYDNLKDELHLDDWNVSQVSPFEVITKLRNRIKHKLETIEGGEINASAYDAAWVALVEDVDGSGGGRPHFPCTLQWIADNQLPDGSWGDRLVFSAYDRLISTLACVIALKRWNVHPKQSHKGLEFVKENIWKLENEKPQHMPVAFEILFPTLMDMAQKLGIDLPHDCPAMQEIYVQKNLKLSRIPMDVLHTTPTSLIFSLEGMQGLEWEKMLKLQCSDGSFLYSPAATAYAVMQTNDKKCLSYLESIVERFGGGVPFVYPVDLFSRNWAVDRLQRLGISRYFQKEISECMNHVYKYWTESGIYTTQYSPVKDIDDTSMGFRLLRLHGFDVSQDVYKHYKNGDQFFTMAGQTTEAVTPMFQLYRASQLSFPGEKILQDSKKFSSTFLQEKQAKNEIFDKWMISKDLCGEVAYALDVPWYASLPRLETRYYLEQYGGESDVWIGKVLYRMGNINNKDYLDLAKLDYNACQKVHQLEWKSIQKWYAGTYMKEFGITEENLMFAYFVASASIFEPERSQERLAWAKTAILIEMVSYYLRRDDGSFTRKRNALIDEISIFSIRYDHRNSSETIPELVVTLFSTIKDLSLEEPVAERPYVHRQLCDTWKNWLMALDETTETHKEVAHLIARTINICGGRCVSEETLLHPDYNRLSHLTNNICCQLKPLASNQVNSDVDTIRNRHVQVEEDMQELVQQVLMESSNFINSNIKQTFLAVARGFYYRSLFDPETIRRHIDKVLYQSIVY